MSADAPREFVDANVLVYAYDSSAGRKTLVAQKLLARLWAAGVGCLSVQVVQEFFVTVTTKAARPLSAEAATDRIRPFGAWTVFAPGFDDVLRAAALHERARLSFWDAMIVHAASELGCDVLWTEDLNDGQIIQGVRIRDPFRNGGTDSD